MVVYTLEEAAKHQAIVDAKKIIYGDHVPYIIAREYKRILHDQCITKSSMYFNHGQETWDIYSENLTKYLRNAYKRRGLPNKVIDLPTW